MDSAKIPLLDPTFLVIKILYNTTEELPEYVKECVVTRYLKTV